MKFRSNRYADIIAADIKVSRRRRYELLIISRIPKLTALSVIVRGAEIDGRLFSSFLPLSVVFFSFSFPSLWLYEFRWKRFFFPHSKEENLTYFVASRILKGSDGILRQLAACGWFESAKTLVQLKILKLDDVFISYPSAHSSRPTSFFLWPFFSSVFMRITYNEMRTKDILKGYITHRFGETG